MRIIAKSDVNVKMYFYKVGDNMGRKKEGTEAPS